MDDYAFMEPNVYEVNRNIYDKHHFYEYINFRSIKSLLELLQSMGESSEFPPEVVWEIVAKYANKYTKPIIRVEARNYEEPYERVKTVDFLVDTGSDVSILTAKTADDLGIDRDIGGGEPIIIKGIVGKGFGGLPRWIYVFFCGNLHPIPVLVPPNNGKGGGSLQMNYLGRAAITSCYLMCFDNRRLYAFARRASEPPIR